MAGSPAAPRMGRLRGRGRVNHYSYDEHTWLEIERMARLALPHGSILQRATLQDDFGAADAHYTVTHRCKLQLRARFNRPAYAADMDVSWRVTEPAMIAKRTYAPLALFIWLRKGYAEAGKRVDVYRMADRINPPLADRPVEDYGSHGCFHLVTIAELHEAGALLMLGGRDRWAPARLGGERDTVRILERDEEPALEQVGARAPDDFDVEAGVWIPDFLNELGSDDEQWSR